MSALTEGSLFTGYDGLGMAVRQVLGARTAWVCEYEPPTKKNPRPTQAAARLLAHRYPGVPNLGDISAVDWPSLPRVDVLTGGFPCQGLSLAGKRLGLLDTRSGLWERMAFAISQLRPGLVVIENVRGLLSAEAGGSLEPCPWCVGDPDHVPLRALGAVLGDLAELGYDARWVGLRAADVGAPHGRFRVFVGAWPATDPEGIGRGEGWPQPAGQLGRPDAALGGEPAAPDTGGVRLGADDGQLREGQPDSAGGPAADPVGDAVRPSAVAIAGGGGAAIAGDACAAAAHADGDGLARVGWVDAAERDVDRLGGAHGAGQSTQPTAPVAWGPYEPAVRRWEQLTRPAPAPTEASARGAQRLSPAFVEWMMGLPAGWVTEVPGLTRNEQLRMLGNGVVPQQAVAALQHLLARDLAQVA